MSLYNDDAVQLYTSTYLRKMEGIPDQRQLQYLPPTEKRNNKNYVVFMIGNLVMNTHCMRVRYGTYMYMYIQTILCKTLLTSEIKIYTVHFIDYVC